MRARSIAWKHSLSVLFRWYMLKAENFSVEVFRHSLRIAYCNCYCYSLQPIRNIMGILQESNRILALIQVPSCSGQIMMCWCEGKRTANRTIRTLCQCKLLYSVSNWVQFNAHCASIEKSTLDQVALGPFAVGSVWISWQNFANRSSSCSYAGLAPFSQAVKK